MSETQLLNSVVPIGAGAAAAGAMLLFIAWRAATRRRPALVCDARVTPWWLRMLWPPCWFYVLRCGYDLSGSPADANGWVTCPECGRRTSLRRHRLRTRSRWRLGRIGFALFTLGASTVIVCLVRTNQWSRYTPATCLLGVAWMDGRHDAGRAARMELSERGARGDLARWQRNSAILVLIRDLRDDHISHNAETAMKSLCNTGGDVIPHAEQALRSSDWQQRQLAAAVLHRWPNVAPSDTLLDVTFEGFRTRPHNHRDIALPRDARAATTFVLAHRDQALPRISEGLRSSDACLRQMCGLLVARGRIVDLYPEAIPVLCESLRDNDVSWDAQGALWSLARMGEEIIEHLAPSLHSWDWQERQLAAEALRRLDAPPSRDLLRVTVEGLRADRLPYDRVRERYSGVYNAQSGVRYLVAHVEEAEDLLYQGMRSGDRSQRFFCAAIAGFAGHRDLIEPATRVLVDHLGDNSIRHDATWAMRALYGFGPEVVPHMLRWRLPGDQQQDDAIAFVIERLELAAAGRDPGAGTLRQYVTESRDDPTAMDWKDLYSTPGFE